MIHNTIYFATLQWSPLGKTKNSLALTDKLFLLHFFKLQSFAGFDPSFHFLIEILCSMNQDDSDESCLRLFVESDTRIMYHGNSFLKKALFLVFSNKQYNFYNKSM